MNTHYLNGLPQEWTSIAEVFSALGDGTRQTILLLFEPGESIEETARRELYEETGAQDFRLYPIGAYAAADDQGESQGMLYFANIAAFGPLPGLEIGEITLAERIPGEWTYPAFQPFLLQRVREWLSEGNPRIS